MLATTKNIQIFFKNKFGDCLQVSPKSALNLTQTILTILY